MPCFIRYSEIVDSIALSRSALPVSSGRTAETVMSARLCVREAAMSTRCHRLVGDPSRTSRWGLQFFGSVVFLSLSRPAPASAIQMPPPTLPHVLFSSLCFSQRKIVNTQTAAMIAATALIRSMMAAQPVAPRSDQNQWTLNLGLKEGLPRKRSSPAVMFSTP